MEDLNPLWVFVGVFFLSAFSGLAALLRAGKTITPLSVFSSMLNSGMLGLSMSLMWHNRFRTNIYFLVGCCILAGLGGATMVDFIVTAFKSGGVTIGGIRIGYESTDDD